MKSLRLVDPGRDPALVDAPVPEPGWGEVLIRVYAAAVTRDELRWYPTLHRRDGGVRQGAVPGHEFSGVVVRCGEGVGALEIGREVFGMNDWFADGAMAEYCVADFACVAPKPARLSYTEAAAVPISALTSWQALYERAKVQPGERVLVHGGAGAVGAFAIQLAKLREAQVTATASGRNLELVRSLGADSVIDYRVQAFEEVVCDVDVVMDTVGGETLARSWKVLKLGGRMVTVAAAGEGVTDARVKDAFFIVEPNQRQLYQVADLLDAGRLRTVVDAVVPLSQAADVYAGRVQRRGGGKLVVSIAA